MSEDYTIKTRKTAGPALGAGNVTALWRGVVAKGRPGRTVRLPLAPTPREVGQRPRAVSFLPPGLSFGLYRRPGQMLRHLVERLQTRPLRTTPALFSGGGEEVKTSPKDWSANGRLSAPLALPPVPTIRCGELGWPSGPVNGVKVWKPSVFSLDLLSQWG